jgi:hypothetical protein
MPYSIRSAGRGKGYRIVNRQTGRTVGRSLSRARAAASVRARMAGEFGRGRR